MAKFADVHLLIEGSDQIPRERGLAFSPMRGARLMARQIRTLAFRSRLKFAGKRVAVFADDRPALGMVLLKGGAALPPNKGALIMVTSKIAMPASAEIKLWYRVLPMR